MNISMTCGDILLNVVICLVTGIIGGLLTGLVVTKYYRKVDAIRQEKERIGVAYSNVASYLEDILNEIEILEKDTNPEFTYLIRLLKKREVRYKDIQCLYGNDESEEYFGIVEKLINLERNNSLDNVDLSEIKKTIGDISKLLLKKYKVIL